MLVKYQGNYSRNKRNLKKPKSTMTCNFFVNAFIYGFTIGFKQGKPYSNVSLIPIELLTDLQMECFHR